ncbi:putative calcium-binding protein CML14 [Camellia lanceoleosa]|uniref:Calcium-binding protein CML14 n=1 Tax=Camellia lanceoleosa TaxID=1840588 RepID=A0ACC0I037_9ERIC|nr:putative calcium-binding protein CML14 [Camellia lanceoleosa]
MNTKTNRSDGARNPDAISGRKPHPSSAQIHRLRGNPKLAVRFSSIPQPHVQASQGGALRLPGLAPSRSSTRAGGLRRRSDLGHILTSIGEKLDPAEFDEWIREVDVGSDGKIRYEDFIARMVAK